MKTLLFTLCLLFFGLFLKAQNCTPDNTITDPGIYPLFLKSATVGDAYEEIMQILSLKDTNVIYLGNPITATIDSINLLKIDGLPGDFSYNCEPSRCVYTHDAVGCLKLSGNPKTTDIGIHPLEIYVVYNARWSSFKIPVYDTITAYELVISDSSMSSISQINKADFKLTPNPVKGFLLHINGNYPANNATLIDSKGKTVLVHSSPEKSRSFSMDLNGLSRGIYYLYIETVSGNVIHKVVL